MVYGNKWLSLAESAKEEVKDEYSIESLVYDEYLNRKSLLEACTDEAAKPILEAQVEVLYEVSIKDIIDKIKDLLDRFIKWVKKIVSDITTKLKSIFKNEKVKDIRSRLKNGKPNLNESSLLENGNENNIMIPNYYFLLNDKVRIEVSDIFDKMNRAAQNNLGRVIDNTNLLQKAFTGDINARSELLNKSEFTKFSLNEVKYSFVDNCSPKSDTTDSDINTIRSAYGKYLDILNDATDKMEKLANDYCSDTEKCEKRVRTFLQHIEGSNQIIQDDEFIESFVAKSIKDSIVSVDMEVGKFLAKCATILNNAAVHVVKDINRFLIQTHM